MKIVAVIPIKLNNERLPQKNTKILGGKPLISYVQEYLNKVDCLDEKYVFCSNEDIKSYLISGYTYLKRPEYLDLPTSNFTQIFTEFSNMVDADIYVYAHATAPFLTNSTVKECIGAVQSGQYDSAFCALKIQDFLWKENKPLNFDPTNIPRSQDLTPIYRETSGVYVFKKEVFNMYKRRIGMIPFIKEVTYKEGIDINTLEDFKLAEKFV